MTTAAAVLVPEREAYVPTGPYVFQSGEHAGQAPEVLMFSDYRFIRWLYYKITSEHRGGEKNQLHCHLEWLLRQGENRQPRQLCRWCGQGHPIKHFLAWSFHGGFGISIGAYYTCCGAESCRKRLEALACGHTRRLLEFKFSDLSRFGNLFDREQVARLFLWAFKLAGCQLDPQAAFRFFSQDASSDELSLRQAS